MLNVSVAILPVLLFLAVLVLMDSFKLVPFRAVLLTIVAGCGAAAACTYVNGWLLDAWAIPTPLFSRYAAPVVEESAKALYVVYLIRRKRIGFLVDAAIHGFAVGAGFAVVENVEYLRAITDPRVFLWIVRGFGTALLHGTTTAIVAMMAKSLSDRHPESVLGAFLPGWATAAGIHSIFNHFILPPLAATGLLLAVLPIVLVVVFERSERATHEWLAAGFDADIEILRLIRSEHVSGTRVGAYLRSLRSSIAGPVVADMLCLLRVQLELSIRAKGMLLAREAGITMEVGPDVTANLAELKYLERSIGRTGLLALKPLEVRRGRDFWEVYLLEQASTTRGSGGATR